MSKLLSSLIIAFSTYSRIPMPRTEWTDDNRRLTFCFFPLVGVPIGLVLVGWIALCTRYSIGPLLKGAIAAALPLLLTGGIHMDGFMDTCDAISSWQPREKRLLILKDSHVGSFAVLGCVLYLLVMAGLFSECTMQDAFSLAFTFVLSRALSACLSVFLPQARKDGMLSSLVNTTAIRALRFSTVLYLVLCFSALIWLSGIRAALLALALLLFILYYRHMALTVFGGVTGDLAGFFLQLAELIAAAALILGGKII